MFSKNIHNIWTTNLILKGNIWNFLASLKSGHKKWNETDSGEKNMFPNIKKTRQHSTQSVRNMPPPSPRHLLPHILRIMHRNPKYDHFQPKGHHNEENPQSTTKMLQKPVSLSQNSAKITKVNRPWPRTNQLWRWSRYISMQNFRPFPPCVLQDMPVNSKFDLFH